mmetsp:Transcript_47070/g.75630  ORF Transcript_47070/g.75630 Transcript_47070/m.75630 type:complete len:277 (-) Transcript_47070:246-1076(-)
MANSNKLIETFDTVELYRSDLKLCDPPRYLNDNLIGFTFEYFAKVLFPKENYLFCPPGAAFVISHEDDHEDLFDTLNGKDVSPKKKLLFFPVNDASDTSMLYSGRSQGNHWSLLVYNSDTKRFYSFDSSMGSNYRPALRLAQQLSCVLPVGEEGDSDGRNHSNKNNNNDNDNDDREGKKQEKPSEKKPVVVVKSTKVKVTEVKCPQQNNGYDCGVYLLAHAKAIAESYPKGMKLESCFEHLSKHVDAKSATAMRKQIPKWIKEVESSARSGDGGST